MRLYPSLHADTQHPHLRANFHMCFGHCARSQWCSQRSLSGQDTPRLVVFLLAGRSDTTAGRLLLLTGGMVAPTFPRPPGGGGLEIIHHPSSNPPPPRICPPIFQHPPPLNPVQFQPSLQRCYPCRYPWLFLLIFAWPHLTGRVSVTSSFPGACTCGPFAQHPTPNDISTFDLSKRH